MGVLGGGGLSRTTSVCACVLGGWVGAWPHHVCMCVVPRPPAPSHLLPSRTPAFSLMHHPACPFLPAALHSLIP